MLLPLENTGPAGTVSTHWRYSVLRPEVLSSFITVGEPSPVSRVTVEALGDMGYQVNSASWDAFRLRPSGAAAANALSLHFMADDVGTPIGSIDSRGVKRFFAK